MPSNKYRVEPIKTAVVKNGEVVGYVAYNNDWRRNWDARLMLSFKSPVQQEINFYGTGRSPAEAIAEAEVAMSNVAQQLLEKFALFEQKEEYDLLQGTGQSFVIMCKYNRIGTVVHVTDMGHWIACLDIDYQYFKQCEIKLYGFGNTKAEAIADALPKLDSVINQIKQQFEFFGITKGEEI